jgi:hypothetical protein
MTYTVIQQGFQGRSVTQCETVDQVWKQLGTGSVGEIYEVSSDDPEEDIEQFMPF